MYKNQTDTDQIKIQIKFKKQTVTKISFSLTTEKKYLIFYSKTMDLGVRKK